MLADSTIRALNKYTEFCEEAARFAGRPRERMVALGEADELFFRLFPHHYRALQVVRVTSQLGKAIYRRREVLQRCESRTVGMLTGVVNEAIAAGDLELNSPQRPDDVAFSVWALVFGTRALMNSAIATHQLGIEEGYAVAHETATLLFDALNWRPLSEEWDYHQTRKRIREELFADTWPTTQAA